MVRKPRKRGKWQINGTGQEERPARHYELQQREAALLDLLHTYPTQVVGGLARRPEAEWHFGRLFLVGAISRDQYEAARYLDRVTRAYDVMLRRYGHVGASKFEKAGGSTVEDLSASTEKRFARVKKRYDRAYELLEQCGDDVRSAIVDALRQDAKTDLRLLDRGLTVLSASVFGMRHKIRWERKQDGN